MNQPDETYSRAQLNRWMDRALELARRGEARGEVPVGAVLVAAGEVVGEGFNQPISACDPTAHAEIIALRSAADALGNYRLPGSTLVVTLEPCTMCVGALLHARIQCLVFGAREPRAGSVVSQQELLSRECYNHRIEVVEGVREAQCGELLRNFFRRRRNAETSATSTTSTEDNR